MLPFSLSIVTMITLLVTATLIILHTPPAERIDVNKDEIVMIREPRDNDSLLSDNVNCIVLTTDGKFIGVVESCDEVREKIK